MTEKKNKEMAIPSIEELDIKTVKQELEAIENLLKGHSKRLEMFLRELNHIAIKEFSKFKQEFINEYFNIHCKKIEMFLKDYKQNPMKNTRDDNGY